MSSIKQLIVNAIIKVSEANPAFDHPGQPTAEEARDHFIKCLLAELFPEDPSMPTTEVSVKPESEPEAGKKKRAPMSEEAKAAAKAKREAKKDVSPPVLEIASSNAAAGAGGAAEPTAEPIKEKKSRKPKPAEGSNLAKIDPTWRKHLKNADKDHAKELEPELLKYLNGLSKEEFDAKKAEEHVADFIASRTAKPEDDGKVEADLSVVEFNGKEYYVNPETKRVYEGEGECDADGNWTNYKGIGYVGMAAFAEMKLEE